MACKAKELSAQGSALGIYASAKMHPARAKALNYNAFALAGRFLHTTMQTQGDALG